MPQESQYDVYFAQADEDGKILHEIEIDYTILNGKPYITKLLWTEHEFDPQ